MCRVYVERPQIFTLVNVPNNNTKNALKLRPLIVEEERGLDPVCVVFVGIGCWLSWYLSTYGRRISSECT